MTLTRTFNGTAQSFTLTLDETLLAMTGPATGTPASNAVITMTRGPVPTLARAYLILRN